MEAEAAKFIGAGLASLALIGAGIGIGNIFGNFVNAGLRNPAATGKLQTMVFIGFALAEATGLFGLVIAFVILNS